MYTLLSCLDISTTFTNFILYRPIKRAFLQVRAGQRSIAALSTPKRWRNPTSASKNARTLSSSCASSQRTKSKSSPTVRAISEVSFALINHIPPHPRISTNSHPSRSPRPGRQTRAPRLAPPRPHPRPQRPRRVRRRKLRGRVRS
jgi:hypothetical protein